MASRYPKQPSTLQPGLLPQSYPPKNGAPYNGPSHIPLPLCLPHRPPGLSAPRPVGGSFQTQAPKAIGRGLAFCLAAVLLQTILIISRTDPLAPFVDIESATRHASMENATLVVEREKTEHEREVMSRERELWEKAREKRVPQGAFWGVISPALDCRAYGKREYSGMLQSIPEGWSAIDACMNMPVEIKGVTIRRPYRCAYVQGSPHIHGYWMVDWDEPGCKPWYRDFNELGCTGYKSGFRRIEAQMAGMNNRKEQDLQLLCNSTPLVWGRVTYTSPIRCEERGLGRRIVALWDVHDESCR